jgi:hypothetical protein
MGTETNEDVFLARSPEGRSGEGTAVHRGTAAGSGEPAERSACGGAGATGTGQRDHPPTSHLQRVKDLRLHPQAKFGRKDPFCAPAHHPSLCSLPPDGRLPVLV